MCSTDRGIALVSVILVLSLALPLAWHLQTLAQVESVLVHGQRQRLQTLYSAEAGIALTQLALREGLDPAEILLGPDGVAGTHDDRHVPLSGGNPFSFPDASFEVTVAAAVLDARRLRVDSRCEGPNGLSRAVEVVLDLDPDPSRFGSVLSWLEIR